MPWEKLPPIEPDKLHVGCSKCSTACLRAPMEMLICVGFGYAYVSSDGIRVYDGEQDLVDGNEPKTVGEIEEMAKADPNHDWRIVKHGPLHGETFQRHGDWEWVCVESNEGFA